MSMLDMELLERLMDHHIELDMEYLSERGPEYIDQYIREHCCHHTFVEETSVEKDITTKRYILSESSMDVAEDGTMTCNNCGTLIYPLKPEGEQMHEFEQLYYRFLEYVNRIEHATISHNEPDDILIIKDEFASLKSSLHAFRLYCEDHLMPSDNKTTGNKNIPNPTYIFYEYYIGSDVISSVEDCPEIISTIEYEIVKPAMDICQSALHSLLPIEDINIQKRITSIFDVLGIDEATLEDIKDEFTIRYEYLAPDMIPILLTSAMMLAYDVSRTREVYLNVDSSDWYRLFNLFKYVLIMLIYKAEHDELYHKLYSISVKSKEYDMKHVVYHSYKRLGFSESYIKDELSIFKIINGIIMYNITDKSYDVHECVCGTKIKDLQPEIIDFINHKHDDWGNFDPDRYDGIMSDQSVVKLYYSIKNDIDKVIAEILTVLNAKKNDNENIRDQ